MQDSASHRLESHGDRAFLPAKQRHVGSQWSHSELLISRRRKCRRRLRPTEFGGAWAWLQVVAVLCIVACRDGASLFMPAWLSISVDPSRSQRFTSKYSVSGFWVLSCVSRYIWMHLKNSRSFERDDWRRDVLAEAGGWTLIESRCTPATDFDFATKGTLKKARRCHK